MLDRTDHSGVNQVRHLVSIPNDLRMDELRKLLEARPLPGGRYPLHVASDLAEHLVWMRLSGLSDRTLVCRRRAVVLLAEWLGHDPATATFDDLDAYQMHLARTSTPGMARWTVSLLRPYYTWLFRRGRRSDDPAALLPIGRRPQGLPRPISEAKINDAIENAPARVLPWLILAGWCALRACEIARLRVEDFTLDRDGAPVVLIHGKGDQVREVPVPAWAWPVITYGLPESGPCWRKQRGFGSVTPQIVSRATNKYLHGIDIADTLHALRHRAATLLLRTVRRTGEGDIRTVQQLLGHSSLNTTQIYTKVESEELAAAVNAMPAPPRLPHLPGLARPGVPALRVVDDTAHGGTA